MSQITKPNLLHNKDFILLFLGGFISRIGNSIHYVALTWFVLETTGSGTATGTILFLGTLPGVLLGPFSGVVADRINRKLLIVGMDLVRGIIVLWLSWTIYAGIANFYYLAIATVLIAISSSFFNPAVEATLPNLVDNRNLQQANSFEHFSLQSTTVVGAAIGGVLIAITGVAGVFLLNGISYILSAISELFINIPEVKEKPSTKVTFWEDLKFGARFLYNQKALFSLFCLSIIINFLSAGVMIVGLPYVFKEVLRVNSKLFGISESIFAVGSIIGALILSFLPEIKRYYRLLLLTTSLQSIALFSLGIPILPILLEKKPVISIYLSLLIILLIFGIINALCNVPINVILQRMIPDNIRGRVFGLLGTLNQGFVPISMAFIGYLLDLVPAYTLFMSAGGLMITVILFGFRIPALKDLDSKENLARGNVAAH